MFYVITPPYYGEVRIKLRSKVTNLGHSWAAVPSALSTAWELFPWGSENLFLPLPSAEVEMKLLFQKGFK